MTQIGEMRINCGFNTQLSCRLCTRSYQVHSLSYTLNFTLSNWNTKLS